VNCTVILSRAPQDPAMPDDPAPAQRAERQAFEDALLAELDGWGGRVLLVPHIYYLADGQPARERLKQVDGRVVLLSWLAPRAAYWTLRALGVDDAEAEGSGDGRIACFEAASFPDARTCAAALRDAAGELAPNAVGATEDLTDDVPHRWYPVIDYARCVGCGKCKDFCLFGVYDRDGTRVVAAEPDRCKDGCPACARLCPEASIMFPHYAADSAIAGAPGTALPEGQADVAAFLDPAHAEKERTECADEADELDALMDALDELDD
jgi:hypothetical protein